MNAEELWAFCQGVVLGFEGGFQKRPDDPGNWTGGQVGKGELRGTKRGISAAAYPDLEIEALTDEQIVGLYKRDYWDKNRCGEMPPRWALAAFDASVLQGVFGAAFCLQRALGVAQDGKIGAQTIAAVLAADQESPRPVSMIRFLKERAFAEDKIIAANPSMVAWAATWEERMFTLAWHVFGPELAAAVS